MPSRQSAPNGAPCWIDLMSSDVARAREFYAQLLGWTASEPDEAFDGYFMFFKDGIPVAGGGAVMSDEAPADIWSIYLATDNAEKTVETASAKGGQVVAPPMVVGDLGTMAVMADNTGAVIGTWQPSTFHGMGIYGEPGTPAWFELFTRDHAAAVDFYRSVFGWETSTLHDTDEFRYTTSNRGDEQLAGIMDASAFLPEGVPAHWSVYFAVADADAATARITELGGAIERPAEDTPYGRMASASDPMGARFKIIQFPER